MLRNRAYPSRAPEYASLTILKLKIPRVPGDASRYPTDGWQTLLWENAVWLRIDDVLYWDNAQKEATMSDTATQLLATFETLPATEQHEIVTQLLRRTSAMPDTPLSDEDLTSVADDLFQMLDAEEDNGNVSNAR